MSYKSHENGSHFSFFQTPEDIQTADFSDLAIQGKYLTQVMHELLDAGRQEEVLTILELLPKSMRREVQDRVAQEMPAAVAAMVIRGVPKATSMEFAQDALELLNQAMSGYNSLGLPRSNGEKVEEMLAQVEEQARRLIQPRTS